MKRKDKNTLISEEEVISLTEKLFNEFSIQELEDRFETDPLLLSNLFNMGSDDISSMGCGCKKIGSCPELTCGCDNGVVTPPPVDVCPELHCAGINR